MATKEAARRPTRAQRADAKRKERMKKMRTRAGSRYRVHYDIDGPRVRLGIAWFVGAMVAFALGIVTTTVYFGLFSAAAGSHSLRTWRARGAKHADPRVALLGVAVVVAAAGVHPRAMGVAVLLLAGGAVGLAVRDGAAFPAPALARASLVLQCALPTAVAGGCLVLLADLEVWAAIALVLCTSAYETGDYLIGSGSTNSVEGPLAGGVAVAVMALAVAALGFPPFSVGQAALFGVAVAPLAFAGQMLASVMLPHARAFAPALRRVDSLLLAAPLWYLGVDSLLI
ncbi:MAG TPA: hypothetical protein VFV42_02850 [Acidimicrobiales bacterium]|nr:hypothetical protein [Acidimicrobiales bacterium]